MVDPDTFLTAVYVTVDECIKDVPVPVHRGPAARLSLSEVVTLALFAQWRQFASERAFYRWAVAHLRSAFPPLPARSQYNRLLRRCHDAIVAVGQRLAAGLDAPTCAYEALDGMGVPTRNAKRRGSGWLAGQADIGRCNRVGWYEGLHLLTAVTPHGALTGYGVAPASTKDQRLAESFLAQRAGLLPPWPGAGRAAPSGTYVADKGFEGEEWHARWSQVYGARVIVPPKRSVPAAWSPALRRWQAGLRQIVETVHDRLLSTFGLEHERPHALDGLLARLAAKVALHNFCLWLNVHLGRPPLAFADLIDW
jgi:Transposase DDE domain